MSVFYTPIYTRTLSSSANNIIFNNIPQVYTDLRLLISCRTDEAVISSRCFISLNSTNTGYNSYYAAGNQSTASSGDASTFQAVYCGDISGNSSTANSFGAIELEIPNYTSSNLKQIINSSISANNSTSANANFMEIWTNRWSNKEPVRSITFNTTSNFVAGTKFSLYGVFAEEKAANVPVNTSDAQYNYYTFRDSGTFYTPSNITADILVVAGGGGAGGSEYSQGGGGGAGGVVYLSNQSISAGTYQVIVGKGGRGGGPNNSPGRNGQNSRFGSLTEAIGGGAGGTNNGAGATSGGSGGGGGNDGVAGGAGTAGQGFAGTALVLATYYGGGGGGASETPPNNIATSRGGNGVTYFGLNVGGGGNGSAYALGTTNWGGGASFANGSYGGNGVDGTGGGGGSAQGGPGVKLRGGNGGSGIVVVRVAK